MPKNTVVEPVVEPTVDTPIEEEIDTGNVIPAVDDPLIDVDSSTEDDASAEELRELLLQQKAATEKAEAARKKAEAAIEQHKREQRRVKQFQLSAEEQAAQKAKELEDREREVNIMKSSLVVSSMFAKSGLQGEQIDDVIKDIVSTDPEDSATKATRIIELLQANTVAVEKATRTKLLKETPSLPGGSGGGADPFIEGLRSYKY